MAHSQTNREEQPRLMYVAGAEYLQRVGGELRYMAAAGFEVTVVGPGSAALKAEAAECGATAVAVQRRGGLGALLELRRVMRERQPHIATMLGAGAGAALAARLAKVPVRIYRALDVSYQGWSGLERAAAKAMLRLSCATASRVLCVSESVRKRLELDGLITPERSAVLASGSLAGVEAERFSPTGDRIAHGRRLRHELGIAPDALVIGYVGPLSSEQGLPLLREAYESLKKTVTGVRLLLVGTAEGSAALANALRADSSIAIATPAADAAPYYHAVDVLVAPDCGAGFPDCVLEAYAAGKPVVAARATGAVDAVMEEGTGLLVPANDSYALAEALDVLLKSPETRRDMGEAGRRWVARDFRPVRIWRELEKEYRRLLEAQGLPLPAREPVTTGFLESERRASAV